VKLRLLEPDQPARELTFTQANVRLGRDPQCELAFDPVRYPKVSGLHAELHQSNGQVRVVPRSRSNQTLVNNEPIAGPMILKQGDRLRLGYTGPEIELLAVHVSSEGRAPEAKPRPPVIHDRRQTNHAPETMMANVRAKDVLPALDCERFDVSKGAILGRDPKLASCLLEHPHVSRVHAKVSLCGTELAIVDLGSANGTFCNGRRVERSTKLSPGDTIDIGPFSLAFDGRWLASQNRADNVQLVARGVTYEVNDRNSRKKIRLLHEIDLVINPGEFICILGPSGSGKSTLLNVLSGRRSPYAGSVKLNDRDLHRNFSALKQDLTVVPQATDLHESLTVEQSFRFTSELRLPSDLDRSEIRETVESTLKLVGLDHRRTVRIANLSGGQLKRAGLGGELLAEPTLLFLDEVTSGLDEHSDGEMMRLFRELADQGKTLACITHNLAHVEESCHLVAVLTVGGRLAFYGPPADAKQYFGVSKLADVYIELQTKTPEEWASKFRQDPRYRKYILDRRSDGDSSASPPSSFELDRERSSALRQFSVLLRRTIAVWKNDIVALATMFGQAALVAVLICMVFGQLADIDTTVPMARQGKIRNLLFLLCISSFWLGCNNSVKELVKERSIFRRERDFNLVPESYLFAKLVFFAVIGIAQSCLLGGLALMWFGIPGDMWQMLAMLMVLSLAGTTLGLAISSIAKNEEVAVAVVPIAIIPQIILAGVVANLSALPEWIARLAMTVYWGQKGIEQALPESDRIASDFEASYGLGLGMVFSHAIVFLVAAVVGLRIKRG